MVNSLLTRAQAAVAALENSKERPNDEIRKEMEVARPLIFGLMGGLSDPDLNPHAVPSDAGEAEVYQSVIDQAHSLMMELYYTLNNNEKREIAHRYAQIIEAVGFGEKTFRDILAACPDLNEVGLDLALNVLCAVDLVVYSDGMDSDQGVVTVQNTTAGIQTLWDLFPQKQETMLAAAGSRKL